MMLKFSKRKKLIVSGCSYTDNYAATQNLEPFKLWPELLAEKLDMDYINLAKCGFGNKAIYTTLTERIINEKNVGLVIPMWTEFQRVSFLMPNSKGEDSWVCFLPERIVLEADWQDKFFKPPKKNTKKLESRYIISRFFRNNEMDNLGAAVSESLNYMYALQTICKSQWIPHLQIQGTHPIMSKNSKVGKQQNKDLSNHIIDSCFIDRIERNFIGWPIVGNIGGYSANSIMKDNHRIGVEDSHPNMLGHTHISEVLYNEYQKIYA